MRTILGVELSGRSLVLVLLFTLVEVVTLTVWIYLVFASLTQPIYVSLAAVELFVGLLVEHTIADVAGRV